MLLLFEDRLGRQEGRLLVAHSGWCHVLQIRHKGQGIVVFVASMIILFYVRLNTCSGECSVICRASCLGRRYMLRVAIKSEIACRHMVCPPQHSSNRGSGYSRCRLAAFRFMLHICAHPCLCLERTALPCQYIRTTSGLRQRVQTVEIRWVLTPAGPADHLVRFWRHGIHAGEPRPHPPSPGGEA